MHRASADLQWMTACLLGFQFTPKVCANEEYYNCLQTLTGRDTDRFVFDIRRKHGIWCRKTQIHQSRMFAFQGLMSLALVLQCDSRVGFAEAFFVRSPNGAEAGAVGAVGFVASRWWGDTLLTRAFQPRNPALSGTKTAVPQRSLSTHMRGNLHHEGLREQCDGSLIPPTSLTVRESWYWHLSPITSVWSDIAWNGRHNCMGMFKFPFVWVHTKDICVAFPRSFFQFWIRAWHRDATDGFVSR